MNWGAVMICWQANSNLKSSLYTKAPSYNTRNDCICHQIFAPLSVPFYPTKTIVHCLKWQFSLFFHLSIMVGKQKILDLEGLWIYIFRFQIKRKQQKLAGFRARSVVGSEYSEYKNNCWCATGSKLVQFAGNHSQHGQRSWVSDEIKTSVVKSFLPDEFLTSPWIVKWMPSSLCFRWGKVFAGKSQSLYFMRFMQQTMVLEFKNNHGKTLANLICTK